MAQKRLYAAYGSNINQDQMDSRCPLAKVNCTGKLHGVQLIFRGEPQQSFATIVPADGGIVPVLVWELQPRDERALDRYEGYPHMYGKEMVQVHTPSGTVEAMAYVMTDQRPYKNLPSSRYFRCIRDGYIAAGFDLGILERAALNSRNKYDAKDESF